MYYREAMVKDWGNPKEITVKQIAECIIVAPEKDVAGMVAKAKRSGRIDSIMEQLDRDLTQHKFDAATNVAFIIETLGDDLIERLGGDVVRDEDDVVIYGESLMPTYIKTYEEALLTLEAIKQVEEAVKRHSDNIKPHNWKRDSGSGILPKKFKAILTEEIATFLADGAAPNKRIKRLSTAIISLSL